jgi:hypothetical protein
MNTIHFSERGEATWSFLMIRDWHLKRDTLAERTEKLLIWDKWMRSQSLAMETRAGIRRVDVIGVLEVKGLQHLSQISWWTAFGEMNLSTSLRGNVNKVSFRTQNNEYQWKGIIKEYAKSESIRQKTQPLHSGPVEMCIRILLAFFGKAKLSASAQRRNIFASRWQELEARVQRDWRKSVLAFRWTAIWIEHIMKHGLYLVV